MAHSFVKNLLHVIFSTKERHKLISKEMQPRLWAYMATIYLQSRYSHEDGGRAG